METRRGSRYWSQIMVKPKTPMTPSAGLHIGRMIWAKMRRSPAPSMRAASSSSRGTSFMNSVITRMENPQAPSGTIIPARVPMRLKWTTGRSERITDSGRARISSGSISVARMATSTSVIPGKTFLARAYPASTETATWSSRPKPTTKKEFSRYASTPWSKAIRKLSRVAPEGMTLSCVGSLTWLKALTSRASRGPAKTIRTSR